MNLHSANLKRIVATVSVLLTSVSCLQQTHAFCQWSGCRPDAESRFESSPCCGCGAAPSEQTSYPPTVERGGECHGADAVCDPGIPRCPTEDACLCCQAPPTPAQSPCLDADAISAEALSCMTAAILIADDANSLGFVGAIASRTELIANDLCIVLCRFLA